ncbi:MAG: PAS domain S-box protein [Smithella sp.]
MDKPLRILILEDNLSDAEIVKFELEEAGFTLTANVVSEKDEFISALQEFEPDIILSDYDLPQYNGALALADAKRICPEVPFILITGAVSEDRAIEILTSGAKDYVMKNRINSLVPAVRRVLAEAEERKARKKAEEELRKAYSELETKVRERTAQLQEEVEQRQQAEEAMRASEERQAFLLKVSDTLRPLADPIEIQDAAMQILGEYLQVSRACYWEADRDDPDYVTTGHGYSINAIMMHPRVRVSDYGPTFLNAYRQGKTVVVTDSENDHRIDESRRAAFRAIGTAAFVGVPLVKKGMLAAILGVHQPEPRKWTFAEISLLEEVAERTWAAVERAKAEDALKKSEDKYRTLFNSMDEGYTLLQLIYDDDKRVIDFLILEANPVEEKLTGLKGITGKKMSEIAPVEKHWLKLYERVAATGKPEQIEKYAEGWNRWFSVHASRVGGAGSQLIACLFDDITERKQTEKLLQKSEAILRSVFDTVPVGLCIVKNRIFQSANKAWGEICGYSESEIIGYSPRLLYEKEEEYERVGRELFTNLEERGFASVQTKHRRKNGDIRDIILTATPLYLDDISSGLALVIVEDITDRKRAEEALENIRRLQSLILDNSTVGIAFIRNRILEWVNPKLCELYGMTEEKLEGASARILYSGEESYQRYGEEIYSLFSQGKKVTIETQMRKEDGSLFWCQWEGIALDPANPLEGSIWIVEDVTDRKQAEKKLEEQRQQLENANKELESFSYSISHDLRAPLRAIEGFSKMILKKQGASFDKDTQNKFNMIRHNTQTMGWLIDGLLELSRLDRRDLIMSTIDMDNLIREVWEEIEIINPGRNMSLAVKLMPQGFGDRQLIRQVYSNLLSNAVKFTKNRDVASIEAGGYTNNGKENIYYVKDNGAGFDMTYYDKLFKVFQRLHSTEEFEGTGIGLATIKRIINKHGGRIWAEGKVNEGAIFYFSLPASHT